MFKIFKKGEMKSMGTKHNNEQNNRVLIDKLRTIIYLESQKPISEMDTDLIDECVDFLMELEEKPELTQTQFEEARKNLFSLNEQKPEKFNNVNRKPRFKGLMIAACLALMLLVANFTAMACGINTIEILKEFGNRIVEMVTGDKEEFKGITIVKDSGSKKYTSIEEFLNEDNFNVLYPTKFLDGVEILHVIVTDYVDISGNIDSKYNDITYITNSQNINMHIRTSPNANKDFLKDTNLEIEVINNIECYILYDSAFIQCNFVHNNYVYKIKTPTKDSLITIIENLKEIE